MAKNKLTNKEIEEMSYTDLAKYVLEEKGKKMKIADLFKEVIKLRGDDVDKIFEEKIGDFYGLISTDKRFIMLKNGFFDLQVNHKNKVVVEDEEEDEDISLEDIDDDIEEEEDEEEDNYDESYDSDDDNDEDDLKGLVIIDEDEDSYDSNL